MLYLKKLKPLEITEYSDHLLVIERPRNVSNLYLKLVIYIVAGALAMYFGWKHYSSMQSMTGFVIMAFAVPIIYLFISVTRLVREIAGWKLSFNRQENLFSINSKPKAKLSEIKEVILLQMEKSDGNKKWLRYELFINTTTKQKIILATSSNTDIVSKLGKAIGGFLNIQYIFAVEPKDES